MTQVELNKDNDLQAQWTRTPAGNIIGFKAQLSTKKTR